jgi:hypothetical protein
MLKTTNFFAIISSCFVLLGCLFSSSAIGADIDWWNSAISIDRANLPIDQDVETAFPEKSSEDTRRPTADELLRFGNTLSTICRGQNLSACKELESFAVVASDKEINLDDCFINTYGRSPHFKFYPALWKESPADAAICLVRAITRHASWALPPEADLCYITIKDDSKATQIFNNALDNLAEDFEVQIEHIASLNLLTEFDSLLVNSILARFEQEKRSMTPETCLKKLFNEELSITSKSV